MTKPMTETELYKAMLDVERRQILLLSAEEKLSPDEMREQMERSVAAIRKLVLEARRRFKLADPDADGKVPEGYTSFADWIDRVHALVMN